MIIGTGLTVGGAETLSVDLLNNFDRALIDPIVVNLSPTGELEHKLKPNIPVYNFARNSRFDLSPANEIARLIKEENIEVALSHGLFAYYFLYCALKKVRMPLRVCVVFHSTLPSGLKNFLSDFVYVRLLHWNTRLISVCYSQASTLSRIYLVSSKRFVVIYNAVNPQNWTLRPQSFDRAQFRESLGLPRDGAVVLQVAGLRKEKCHEDSIRALAHLRSVYPGKVSLVIVGKDHRDQMSMLRRLANDLGVGEWVRFCGLQLDPQPFYWATDLFTLSSTAVETFSIAALEALACGVPCVLTDVGGAREMIKNGENGFLVPPSSPKQLALAWKEVLQDPARFSASHIRQDSLTRFSFTAMVARYTKLLVR
jgi:glycosyltransferase involved in cell wall biosynthesis